MDLSKLTLADKVLAGTGIVLLIDLLFLPWHNIDLGIVSVTRSGVESPNSGWGILALIVTIVVLVAVALTRFSTTELPRMPVPLNRAVFIGAVVVLVFLVIKLVAETDFLGIGAWLGIILGVGFAYGGFLKDREPSSTSLI